MGNKFQFIGTHLQKWRFFFFSLHVSCPWKKIHTQCLDIMWSHGVRWKRFAFVEKQNQLGLVQKMPFQEVILTKLRFTSLDTKGTKIERQKGKGNIKSLKERQSRFIFSEMVWQETVHEVLGWKSSVVLGENVFESSKGLRKTKLHSKLNSTRKPAFSFHFSHSGGELHGHCYRFHSLRTCGFFWNTSCLFIKI